jgi:hypothetical protein
MRQLSKIVFVKGINSIKYASPIIQSTLLQMVKENINGFGVYSSKLENYIIKVNK